MASQLSGERPSATDSRNAISGVTRLETFKTRLSVEGGYPELFRQFKAADAVRIQVSLGNELPRMGGLCIFISTARRKKSSPSGGISLVSMSESSNLAKRSQSVFDVSDITYASCLVAIRAQTCRSHRLAVRCNQPRQPHTDQADGSTRRTSDQRLLSKPSF